jgi:hypothetical protein
VAEEQLPAGDGNPWIDARQIRSSLSAERI